jgi:hypothetical protein
VDVEHVAEALSPWHLNTQVHCGVPDTGTYAMAVVAHRLAQCRHSAVRLGLGARDFKPASWC